MVGSGTSDSAEPSTYNVFQHDHRTRHFLGIARLTFNISVKKQSVPNSKAHRLGVDGLAVAKLTRLLDRLTRLFLADVAGYLGFRCAVQVWSKRYRCSVNPGQYTAGQNPGRLLRWFDLRSASALHAVNPLLKI